MSFGIQELIALIKNIHTVCTTVIYYKKPEELKKKYQYYPVRFYLFDDGMYVLSTPNEYKKALGKKVLKNGNLTAEETVCKLARLVSADNDISVLASIPWCLNNGQLLHYIGASNSAERQSQERRSASLLPWRCSRRSYRASPPRAGPR
ncbi:MAG: hypothetical protein MIO92_06385 [Methanosarcinaceae archaeon]|nr:hypothetical protein [Methanosarcinaceae archaeon]